MKVGNVNYRTIWIKEKKDDTICIIDQRFLPHKFVVQEIRSVEGVVEAIKNMHVRGAGLIGAAAGYGMYLATLKAAKTHSFEESINMSANLLKNSRPTAVNLEWAVNRQLNTIMAAKTINEKINAAKETALAIANEDSESCKKIGSHGVSIIEDILKRKKNNTINILTHCNAGWLAFVDHGSATSPIYEAQRRGIKVHVWVDETRPRNQGASLTAWELLNQSIAHTVIADNVGGHLMQHGLVDMVITGADRVTRVGDTANKIGTYLKALAAFDNNVPFYVALPSSTFDWKISDGIKEIPIEERDANEVKYVQGLHENEIKSVLVTPQGSSAANYGFDVTPARLITGLITERGICKAEEKGITDLFPENK